MSNLFEATTQSLLSRSFLSDVRSAVSTLFNTFYIDSSYLKNYVQSNGTLTLSRQHFNNFLSFNQVPLALRLQKVLLEVRVEAQRQLIKIKAEKSLLGHIIDILRNKVNGVREEYVNEEIKQLVYYLWSILRSSLPDIDATVTDQLLLLIFEQL